MIINVSVDGLVAWIRSKNWTAHSIAGIAGLVAIAITTDQQVKDFLFQILKDHPTLAADIVAAAMIYAKYSHSSSAAGKLAAARAIQASPKAPSEEAVLKATTFPQLPKPPASISGADEGPVTLG